MKTGWILMMYRGYGDYDILFHVKDVPGGIYKNWRKWFPYLYDRKVD